MAGWRRLLVGASLGAAGLSAPALYPRHDLATPLAQAIEQALGRPPGTVHVGRARFVVPSALRVEDLRAGSIHIGQIDLEVGLADAARAFFGGPRPRLTRVQLRSVGFGALSAEVVDLRREGAQRLAVRKLCGPLSGWPLALSAHELAVDFT